ncbi:cryptochrome DASH [Aphanothece hegewaldii CCALA 016]|uniref:Cryptochrome DASH n=1 Tax=Aphanothece hegewaldii CCALA 016 TaxID=2107694 RepID=A0A2T1M0S6_9CHRO|nr:DASH family cryptochrome [Aphanothece hegewaldii]PSF38185.1 cryptochrome DASH [Aphanothece hegewaldii CCALA 016]
MTQQRILIWYRNDLRIHDHEPLYQALKEKAQIIPFYCFDSRQFGQTPFGFPKTGSFRTQFLLFSITNLKNSLQKLGSDLIIRQGKPENIITDLVKTLEISTVYYHQEVTAEELAVEKALAKNNIKIKGFWGTTLYHPDDLPFEINQLPELFTNFRKKVEKDFIIRHTFPFPKQLPSLPEIDVGTIPSFEDLGVEKPILGEKGVLIFQGGETAGLTRLKDYFWHKDSLKVYKETRNGMLGSDYSSKFSAWLSLGCLSPRYIYEQVQKYESERIKNDSTYWLIFELLWRDFFRFICAKHGNKIFYLSGLQGLDIPWKVDETRFKIWQEGKTGYPLVDANMRELLATGFMSNRGRQNVASFLTKNLGINWQMGSEWFESMLIDYDVCSNWGNWNYTAGVGNDARGFRYFNIPKQSKDYDPNGEYLKYWLPELESIPGDKIHEPWKLSQEEQKRYGVILGVDYPRPVVDFFKSVQDNEKIYNGAISRK